MSPRRQLALATAFLVVLHAGAGVVLWTAGSGPPVPEPRTDGSVDEPRRLLAAAVHNSATFPSTTGVRISDPANGSVRMHFQTAVEPSAAQLHQQVISAEGGPLLAEEAYLVGWGRWLWRDGGWEYYSRTGMYDDAAARLLDPPLGPETAFLANRTGDGRVRVTIPKSPVHGGVLSLAGVNATLTYTIAVRDGVPYVQRAVAVPDTDDNAFVHLRRDPGATVSRPSAIPRFTLSEAVDRLIVGRRY